MMRLALVLSLSLHLLPAVALAGDLWISNHTDFPGRKVLVDLAGRTNFTYDAKGATLTVGEPAIALHLKDCRNVTIRNLTIDWERPVLTEARVVGFSDGETRIRIDTSRYPVAVEEGRLLVIGPERRERIRAVRFLDGQTGVPVPLTADTSFRETCAREETDGTIVLKADYSHEGTGVKVGDILVFRPFDRPYPAVFIEDSSGVLLEDVVIRDAYGMGVIAQMSEDIAWRGTGRAEDRTSGVIVREGSHVTTHADASHFSNCRGQVTVENCWFEGMMDDAINVHSTCVQITNVLSRSSIRCVFRHPEAIGFTLFRPGERARLIRSRTNEDGPVLAVAAVRRIADDAIELDFGTDMPGDFGIGDTVENADYQCAATFRGNVVRNNRARGVLFTTPGKVICSSNRFERCCGSAIVLASDAAYWFESGHCRDVEIAGNVISNCLTAGYGRHGSAFGVISIDPIVRELAAQRDFCHSNIRIFDNEIFTFDATLLFARSTKDIHWRNNAVHYKNDFKGWGKPPFVFERVTGFRSETAETGNVPECEVWIPNSKDGTLQSFRFHVPEHPTPTEKFAAEELARWLDRRKADLGGCCLTLRQDETVGADAFHLRIGTNRVEIVGGVRGVLYGAYEFLQRFCGIEWFARDTTVCPEGGRIVLPESFDLTERPAFDMRELYFYGPHVDGDFAARLRLNGNFGGLGKRHGGTMCPVGAGLRSHTFHRLVPHETYGETHPEYFALRGGKRLARPKSNADFELQLCLSNPEVREVLEGNLLKAIAADPEGGRFGVFQNDNMCFCQCADCSRIATEEGSQAGPIVRFVNAVAGTVRRARPDLLVQTGAYQYSRHPSRTAYADNVLLEICTIERDLTETIATGKDGENAAIRRDFDGWAKRANHLYVFDYATDFHAYQMPIPNIAVLQDDMRHYRDRGFRWVTVEGPYHGTGGDLQELKAYLLAKLMWHPDVDVARLTEAFLAAYYGKAAPIVREYLAAERALGLRAGARRMTCFAAPTDASVVTDEFLGHASEIWRRALLASRDDAERVRRHVRGGAFGVDLIRYYRLCERFKPADFSLRRTAMSKDAAYADFVSLARRLQDYLKSEPTVCLCEGMDRAERPRRSQLAEAASGGFANLTAPVAVDKVEIGVDGLALEGLNAGHVAVVAADGALGGKAVRLANTSFDWCVQKELPVGAFDDGVAYRLRFRAKMTKKAGAKATGAAFSAGLVDRKACKSVLDRTFSVANAAEDWAWYDLGAFMPGERRFFWFASGRFDKKTTSENPDVREVVFDRLEISRVEK